MTVLKQKGFIQKREARKGFTLIELLIVIAILGTLAVVVLLALNPVQQLARTRDAGRQSSITQMGHALEALATVRGGAYPAAAAAGDCTFASGNTGTDWITNCLVTSGEIQAAPTNPTYTATPFGGCGAGAVAQNNFCYEDSGGAGLGQGAVVYTTPEATNNLQLCTAGEDAYFVYATLAGRGGIWCGAAAPPGNLDATDTGWVNF